MPVMCRETPGWLTKFALATGFPSGWSLLVRSAVGFAGVVAVQRFVLYPSAALGFDAVIAVAVLAILLLLGYFVARGR